MMVGLKGSDGVFAGLRDLEEGMPGLLIRPPMHRVTLSYCCETGDLVRVFCFPFQPILLVEATAWSSLCSPMPDKTKSCDRC